MDFTPFGKEDAVPQLTGVPVSVSAVESLAVELPGAPLVVNPPQPPPPPELGAESTVTTEPAAEPAAEPMVTETEQSDSAAATPPAGLSVTADGAAGDGATVSANKLPQQTAPAASSDEAGDKPTAVSVAVSAAVPAPAPTLAAVPAPARPRQRSQLLPRQQSRLLPRQRSQPWLQPPVMVRGRCWL